MRRSFFLFSLVLAFFLNYALFRWMKWYAPSPRPFVFALAAYNRGQPWRMELQAVPGFVPPDQTRRFPDRSVSEHRFDPAVSAAMPDVRPVAAIRDDSEQLALPLPAPAPHRGQREETATPFMKRERKASLRRESIYPESPAPSFLDARAVKPQAAAKPPQRQDAAPSGPVRQFREKAEPLQGAASFYPQAGLNTGQVTRSVAIAARINGRGVCVAAKVVRSSGFPAVDQTILKAVRSARYRPAVIGGVAVETEETFEIPVHRR